MEARFVVGPPGTGKTHIFLVEKFEECFSSNTIGTNAVFKFCLNNKIKLIYSATSANLGNQGNDKKI